MLLSLFNRLFRYNYLIKLALNTSPLALIRLRVVVSTKIARRSLIIHLRAPYVNV